MKNRAYLMRLSALPAAIVLTAFSASAPASALDRRDIQGIWRHPDTGSLIQIYSCGGGVCAKVASTADPNLKDVKNPDPALRDRLVAGVVLWQRPKESGELQWIGSTYNAADGGTYYGTMHLTSPTTLAMSGCNLSVMICADQIWTKVDPQNAKAPLTTASQPKTAPAAATPAAPVQAVAAPAAPVRAAAVPAAPVQAAAVPAAPVQPRPCLLLQSKPRPSCCSVQQPRLPLQSKQWPRPLLQSVQQPRPPQ